MSPVSLEKGLVRMRLNDLQPVRDEPVLLSKKYKLLVVADIHIGIENEFHQHGIGIDPQSIRIINHLTRLIERYKPRDVILLGDVKHTIPSTPVNERMDVRKLIESISLYDCLIHIVPGNHDGGLKNIIPGIDTHPSTGFVYHDTGFIHGHCWPSREIIESRCIVAAHTHPTIMLHDRLGYTLFEPCWLHGYLDKGEIRKHYRIDMDEVEVTVMPAFNRICGGTAINKDGIVGPLNKVIDIPNLEVFLMDGSYLGLVKNIH